MLKLVPFNNAWITNDKLDLKAVYRRPRWTKDEFDQDVKETGPDGLPMYDLTTPLPVKQHNKWAAKGFEYITLADRNSLIEAYKKGTLVGANGMTASPREFDQHQTGGPWNAKMYMADQNTQDNTALLQLRANVQKFGSEAYEAIRREVDATFTLPKHLQSIEPGGELPPLVDPKTAKATSAVGTPAAPTAGRRRRGVSAAGKKPAPKKKDTPKEPVQA